MRLDGNAVSIGCLTMLLRCLHDSSTDPLRLMTAARRFTTVELRILTMPPRFDTVLVHVRFNYGSVTNSHECARFSGCHGTVCQIMTPNIHISLIFDKVSHAIKKKRSGKIKTVPDPPARLSPVPSPVSCPVVSDEVPF